MRPVGRRDLLKRAGAFALAAALPAPARAAGGGDKVTLAWAPVLQSLPLCVARDEGLFERAGLEIEVMRLQAQAHLVEAVVSGRADASAPGASVGLATIAEAREPGSLRVSGFQGASNSLNRVTDGLIALRQAPIAALGDLRGRSLGHLPGASWRTVARHMVRRAGLDPERDVRFVELAGGLHGEALTSGTVEAVLSVEPVVSLAVASGTAKRILANPAAAAIADPFFAGASLIGTGFVRERPDVARRLIGALDEATSRIEADFDRYRPLIAHCTGIEPAEAGLVPQPYLKGWRDLGEADRRSYRAFVETLVTERALSVSARGTDMILKPGDFSA